MSWEEKVRRVTPYVAGEQPQKKNITDGNLYTHPEADIQKGDILYVYEKDEYDNKVESTEFKTIADRPYKKRTKLIVPLLAESEV